MGPREAVPLPGGGRWLACSLYWGFVLHTAMIAPGSVYRFMLFGRAWSFDPVETPALVAWAGYGTLLRLHLFVGWEGRRLASWCPGARRDRGRFLQGDRLPPGLCHLTTSSTRIFGSTCSAEVCGALQKRSGTIGG